MKTWMVAILLIWMVVIFAMLFTFHTTDDENRANQIKRNTIPLCLPDTSKGVEYLGNKWYKFNIDGKTYIYRDK